jgi:hypothetical protein
MFKMWSHNVSIYSIINLLANILSSLFNHILILTDFFRFASFFLPQSLIFRENRFIPGLLRWDFSGVTLIYAAAGSRTPLKLLESESKWSFIN